MPSKPREKPWVFPTKKCPHCHGYRTYATHTDSERGIQYRRCSTPICRGVRFTVRGLPAGPQRGEANGPTPDGQVCPFCQKSYRRQGDLTRHINRLHGEMHDGRAREED